MPAPTKMASKAGRLFLALKNIYDPASVLMTMWNEGKSWDNPKFKKIADETLEIFKADQHLFYKYCEEGNIFNLIFIKPNKLNEASRLWQYDFLGLYIKMLNESSSYPSHLSK